MNAIYIIRDAEGNEVNRVVGTEAFVEANYPGQWELVGPAETPVPAAPVRIDTPLFIMRFTPEERIDMRAAAKANEAYSPLVDDWLQIIYDPRLAYVELGDPNLVAAMGMMVSIGLLTQARADEVMTP